MNWLLVGEILLIVSLLLNLFQMVSFRRDKKKIEKDIERLRIIIKNKDKKWKVIKGGSF